MADRVRFRGRWTCKCVATSLPLVEDAMKRAGVIKYNIDIFQAGYNTGGVSASAGTHDRGGCVDVGQFSDAALKIWREWGWTQQHRTPSQGFKHHGHGFPKGCSHLSSGARYQASEWNSGRNGLRSRGAITGPGPKGKATPTWGQAIKNHKAVAKKPARKPAPKPARKPAPKGILGMTKSVYVRYSEEKKLKKGQWTDAWINDKHFTTVIGENKTVAVTATVRLIGLRPDEWAEICWRIVEVVKEGGKDVTKVRHWRAPTTVIGIAGHKLNETTAFAGAVPKNQRLRVAVRTSSDTASIAQLEVQGWKE